MIDRYYFSKFDQEYYIFDSQEISQEDFKEKLVYQGFQAFENSMTPEEILSTLNSLNNENRSIKHTIQWMLENTKTEIGKSVLQQLQELIQ